MYRHTLRALILASLAFFGPVSSPIAQASTESVLGTFDGSNGAYLYDDGLVADTEGNLYGSTSDSNPGGYGVIFELTPPAAGQTAWTKTVIHMFADNAYYGANPVGTLAIDHQGALYGTTQVGARNGWGNVFKLAPPATKGGVWTISDLHDFVVERSGSASDGFDPQAGVVFDASGNLYGSTLLGGYDVGSEGEGTVFELTPPASGSGAWTETVLHRFEGTPDGAFPYAPLIIDQAGALYGTTMRGGNTDCLKIGCGVVFKLTPPKAGASFWTETVLHRFAYVAGASADGRAPMAGLVAGPGGILYGTTELGGGADVGTVFQLTPPPAGQTGWTETILHSFTGIPDGAHPVASLLLSATGTLTGTTVNGGTSDWGTVFTLAPPVESGDPWTESVLYRFLGTPGLDGAYPESEVISDVDGNLYGTTFKGGRACSFYNGRAGCGTVFALTP